MLFGMLPYYHENRDIMFQLIREFPLVFPKDHHVDDHCLSLIRALLNRDPLQRLHSKQAVMNSPWLDTPQDMKESSPFSMDSHLLANFEPEITNLPTISFCYE